MSYSGKLYVTEDMYERCRRVKDSRVRGHVASIIWFGAHDHKDESVQKLNLLRMKFPRGCFPSYADLERGLRRVGLDNDLVRHIIERQKSLDIDDAANQRRYKLAHTQKMKAKEIE